MIKRMIGRGLGAVRSWIGAGSTEYRSGSWSFGRPDVLDNFWYGALGPVASSGAQVSPASAEQMVTVASCATLLAGDIAALPLRVMRPRPSGKGYEADPGHRLSGILGQRPNSDMVSYTWRQTTLMHLLVYGACYSLIRRDRVGGVLSLYPIHPSRVRIRRDQMDGELYFRVSRGETLSWAALMLPATSGSVGGTIDVPARDMLYAPAYSRDGVHGVSPVTHYATEAVGTLISMEDFVGVFFRNGMDPGLVIEMPAGMYLSTLDKQAAGNESHGSKGFLASLLRRYGNSGQRPRSPLVLQGGMSAKPYQATLVDAQFIQILGAKKRDICGLYKVPPHKVAIEGTSSSYNNTEQENIGYITHAVVPWTTLLEQAMGAKLLSPQERNRGYHVMHDVTAILRGDMGARASYYHTLWQIGALSPDEIRIREGLAPLPDGGELTYIPMSVMTIAEAKAKGELAVRQAEATAVGAAAIESQSGGRVPSVEAVSPAPQAPALELEVEAGESQPEEE